MMCNIHLIYSDQHLEGMQLLDILSWVVISKVSHLGHNMVVNLLLDWLCFHLQILDRSHLASWIIWFHAEALKSSVSSVIHDDRSSSNIVSVDKSVYSSVGIEVGVISDIIDVVLLTVYSIILVDSSISGSV